MSDCVDGSSCIFNNMRVGGPDRGGGTVAERLPPRSQSVPAGNRHHVAEFKLLFLFASGIILGDTGRRIGMGRYADVAHGGGEGMHMGVAECVQRGCADVGEC